MVLKIAICDDEDFYLDSYAKCIKEFVIKNQSLDLDIQKFSNGTDLIAALERKIRYDIIFLDVMMPLMNGIQVANEIREKDQTTKIIFLTFSREYALDSYDVNAFSYLLKDAPKEKLFSVISKAIEEIDNKKQHTVVKFGDKLIKINYHNIEFVEINLRKIIYYKTNGELITSYGTFYELENLLLAHSNFIKPHRAYIVNMDYIKEIVSYEIITQQNYKIPIPRASFTKVKSLYFDYSFGYET